jgi:hypothetical protein
MIGNTGRSFLAALFAVTPLASHALSVLIEPDDYAIGTDLSNISPYVTLQKLEVYMGTYTYLGPVYSSQVTGYPDFNPPAPTGDQTFGNYGHMPWGTALGLVFNTEVSNVSLLANNFYPFGVDTYWRALDADGVIIASGSAGGSATPAGENYLIEVNAENMAMLILGAGDGSNTSRLDHLSFEVDVAVPEPSALILLGAGLAGILMTKKRSVRR